MTDDNEDGIHVDSGSFRVDRRRALDKLMRFQLPQAELFMLPWVRCAVASGASYVKLGAAQEALELRFDGRPFLKAELADPYSCLFDRHRPENRRNRELAIGLLSVLRLKPLFASVSSGAGGSRVRLRVESVANDQLDPSQDPAAETIIKVVPSDQTPPLWSPERAELVESYCRVSPIPLWLSGRAAARSRQPEDVCGVYFEAEDVHGWLTVPAEPGPMSTLEAYTLGVFVAPTQLTLPLVQVEGYIDDDQFALNASQTGVARNTRFLKQTTAVLSEQAEALVRRVIGEQASRLEDARAMVRDSDLLYYWRNRIERGALAEKPSPLEGAKESVKGALRLLAGVDLKKRTDAINQLQWTARATAWLRDAAGRLLSDPSKDSKTPLLAALWEAPIELDVEGAPLSLADLERQRRRLGYIPVCQAPAPGQSLPFRAVWVISPRDVDVLVKRFPDTIRDVTGHLDLLASAAPAAGSAAPAATLEAAGVAEVLIRDTFEKGELQGEIGLSVLPHEKGARVSFLKGGKPASFVEMPCPLRFDAVLSTALNALGQGLEADLRRAAEALYPKLLAEYDCWKAGERNEAIRGHLMDLLIAAQGREDADARWAETVPIFDFVESWYDYDRLRAAVREGRPVFLAPDHSAAQGLNGRLVLSGARFTDEFLARLLPGCRTLGLPARPDLRVLVSPTPAFACPHAGAGCLAERQVGSISAHLAVGPGPGQPVALPWGEVRALAPAPLSEDDQGALAADYTLLFELVAAIAKSRGSLEGPSGDPERRFLLSALQYALAPWPGRGPARPRQNLIELIDQLPFFRRPAGAGWGLSAVMGRIASAIAVSWAAPGAEDAAKADLLLEPAELGLAEALWPGLSKHLVPVRELAARAAAAEPAPAPAAPAPAPYAPPPHLVFDDPMLFSRLYRENGLSARIGLPAKSAAPALWLFRNGKPVEWAQAPPFVGAARVEIGGWRGPGPAPAPHALLALFHRFYMDLAEHWPVADPSSLQHAAALEQVLKLLGLHADAGYPEALAQEERARLETLKMFRTLAGGFRSLADLSALARARGALPFAERDFLPVPEEDAPVPVLAPAQAKAVAALLGAKALAVKPPPPPEEAPAEPEPAAPEASEPEGIARARHMLRHLRGRRGLKLRSMSLSLAPEADPEGKLVAVQGSGGWVLQPYHPLVMTILGSSLPAAEQAAYLASLVYTAANRELETVTDQDDERFQQALADFVASPEPE